MSFPFLIHNPDGIETEVYMCLHTVFQFAWLQLKFRMAGQIAKGLSSTLTLNDGVVMPMYGFGTYQLGDHSTTVNAVKEAIIKNYRLVDTAQFYK